MFVHSVFFNVLNSEIICAKALFDVNILFFSAVNELKHKPTIVLETAPEVPDVSGKKKKKPRAQNNCLNCKKPG